MTGPRRLQFVPARGPRAASLRRSGVTLVEVLMSLMLMGIGVVAVASLFPLSILRTIHATQLTQATLLRYNAEDYIHIHPELLDPPGGGETVFVVDPLGWQIATDDADLPDTFGTDPADTTMAAGAAVPRLNAGFNSLALAEDLVASPNSWEPDEDLPALCTISVITGADTATGDTVDLGVDLSGMTYLGNGDARVVVFNESFTKSWVRDIASVSGTTLVTQS